MAAQIPETKVLIVDDHHDGAETLGAFLRLIGCQVRLVNSGEAALALAPEFQPSLVILDVQMPGIDGLETARQLRRQAWARRSVFATHSAAADPAIVDLSRAAGCQQHIRKPADTAVFERLLELVRAQESDAGPRSH